MLTSRGLEVYTRPDGRIFPVNGTAKDVVAILKTYLQEAGIEIRLETPVRSLIIETQRDGEAPNSPSPPDKERAQKICTGVQTDHGLLQGKVILATGGSSYPNSGTTGDGWPWAREAGHTVVKILAALAPMTLKNAVPERAGIALRSCVLKARGSGKELARWRDDLLFTHRGISGPTALGVSREVSEAMQTGRVTLHVDIAPDETFESLTKEIIDWSRDNPRKRIATYLEDRIPKNLVEDLMSDSGIPEETIASNLPQKARNKLIENLKAWSLGEVQEVVLDKGEVVAGGIALNEVDPHTMASKKCEGLYLCGEVLDIAGPVGGYNLQAAFATGYVAGESAAT